MPRDVQASLQSPNCWERYGNMGMEFPAFRAAEGCNGNACLSLFDKKHGTCLPPWTCPCERLILS